MIIATANALQSLVYLPCPRLYISKTIFTPFLNEA
jgi:hypothetical protein